MALTARGTPPSVSYVVTGLPPGATFDPDTLLLSWIPGANQAGSYTITVTATDDGNGTGTPRTSVTTVPILSPECEPTPVIAEIGNQFVDRNTTLELPVSATDPDGNPLTLTVTGLPPFATFVDNGDGTGVFRFSPVEGDRGDYVITLIASDNGMAGRWRGRFGCAHVRRHGTRAEAGTPVLEWLGESSPSSVSR
jgi:hypothetical protein